MSEIDSAKGSVCMHFLLVAHWIDEGLEGVDPREVDWSKAFSPNLQLQDDLSVETLHEEMHLSHTSHGPLVAFTRRYVCRGPVTERFFRIARLDHTHSRALLCDWDLDRYRGDISQSFGLLKFPFDSQTLSIVARCGHPASVAVLAQHSVRRDAAERLIMDEWDIGRMVRASRCLQTLCWCGVLMLTDCCFGTPLCCTSGLRQS